MEYASSSVEWASSSVELTSSSVELTSSSVELTSSSVECPGLAGIQGQFPFSSSRFPRLSRSAGMESQTQNAWCFAYGGPQRFRMRQRVAFSQFPGQAFSEYYRVLSG